jgi:phosphate/sulfate permease
VSSPIKPPRIVWWQRIGGAICLLAFFAVWGTIIFGQLRRHAIDLWLVDPRLWNTHPLTQPIETAVFFIVALLAAAVGSIFSWWSKRSR